MTAIQKFIGQEVTETTESNIVLFDHIAKLDISPFEWSV